MARPRAHGFSGGIIVYSSDLSAASAAAYEIFGVEGMITKSPDLTELRDAVAQALRKHASGSMRNA